MPAEAPSLHSSTPSALPVGTRLGEFELLRLLGVGGFGIVYLAFDHALEREVAVKEYLPASLAGRTETLHVSLRSQSDAETFALGLKSFVNEARLLARFDHPSLLKVHRFWEGNGTAYMAMPVLRGRTVKEVRQEMAGAPDEVWLRALLEPLLGAIEKLHSEGVYHRDIAPDNIQIEPDGHPVLLDFGAARRVLSDKSQALTAILKPAYAPIEQYAEAGSVKQGPWTDLYALGATLHYVLMGRPPAPATARAIHDDASALTTAALPGCSENFLHTIDWMLAPRPIDRPQSVAALREVLDGHAAPPVRRHAPAPTVSDWERTVMMPGAATGQTAGQVTAAVPRTQRPPAPPPDFDSTVVVPPTRGPFPSTAMPRAAAAFVPDSGEPETIRIAPPASAAGARAVPLAEPAAPTRSKLIPVGLGVGALVLVAVAALVLTRKPAPAPVASEMPAASAPAAAATVAPAASVAESAVTTVVVPSPAAAPAPAPVKHEAPPPEPIAHKTATAQPAPGLKPAAASPKPAPAAPVRNAAVGTAISPAPAAVVGSPPPETSRPRADAPAPTSPPSVAPAVAEALKPAAPATPEALCGGRNPLSYFVCMEKECLRSEQVGTADCKKWRAGAKRDQ